MVAEQVMGWAVIAVLLPVGVGLVVVGIYGMTRWMIEIAVERHVDKPHARKR